jgi:gas vesicle protein
MRTIGKLSALVAGGAIVGAGLGLLFAPHSGSDARRIIRHHARKAQVEAGRLAKRVKRGVERVKSAVANGVPEIKAA